jgi:hypothetical protein
MVWAVSHDTAEAKYSKALGRVSHRTHQSRPSMFFEESGDAWITTENHHPQCKWSNCGEYCPPGWKMMVRVDSDRHSDNEIMLDITSCTNPHGRRLCCPSSETLPECGWYGYNGGKCEFMCPGALREVGSTRNGCRKGYQAACCSVRGEDRQLLNAMRLYENCDWAEAPECDSGKCTFASSPFPTEFVLSHTGSGDALCNWKSMTWSDNGRPLVKGQKRKYCCDRSDQLSAWGKCQWRSDLGEYSSSGKQCKSGCASNEVPIAMNS